jgi:SAM-dependent methyltransferase
MLLILKIINIFTGIIPDRLTTNLLKIAILLRAYSNNPKKDMVLLFKIKDAIENIINNRALSYGNSEHPKHYLTKYHQFFINNISDGESVIDVGCGYGSVSRSIAKAKTNSKILGIDNDKIRLQQAIESDNPPNLSFIYDDIIGRHFNESWDVIVLSNVLEHIEHRVEFMLEITSNTNAKKVLIRVPCYERDWQVPLRDEFGINYFSDSDHKIEHTLQEFQSEMDQAQLEIIDVVTSWGEIWAVCIPVNE